MGIEASFPGGKAAEVKKAWIFTFALLTHLHGVTVTVIINLVVNVKWVPCHHIGRRQVADGGGGRQI
jgi:hypothetical protein